MNRREAERLTHQESGLMSLGFTRDEANKLRRISNTLRRWHELECGIDGGCVERDETTGKTFWRSEYSGKLSPIADRETGARKRLAKIIEARNIRSETRTSYVTEYIQTDPRGAALYILRPGDVPEGKEPEAYYSRGICVY